MLPGDDVCYAALTARDARFDGQFFVGVSSTGIYCRPVCPARTPRRSSCAFFPSAAAAESGGYRPCLRCRPELAPGNASVDAVRRVAHAAAARIDDGGTAEATLQDVARALGVTDRHLRRVFEAEFGVSPVTYAQTQRLLLARRLLRDTSLPVTDVALAAGFRSIRRFNAAFLAHYRVAPRAWRRDTGQDATDRLTFDLAYRPPLAWEALLGFLESRTIDGVESVASNVYRRVVRLEHLGTTHAGWLQVERSRRRHALRVALSPSLAGAVPAVLGRVKRLFDLSCRPDEVAAQLGALATREPGLRVPGAFDGFELAVRAVLGQQITVRAARTLAGRLARELGPPAETPFNGLARAFPTPAEVARAGAARLGRLGIISTRAHAIVAIAKGCASGRLALHPGSDVEATMAQLVSVPGIGDWTAQYIAMRALSWPDACPAADYGVKKALGESSPARVRERAEAWRPWRAYATMHLWRSLQKEHA